MSFYYYYYFVRVILLYLLFRIFKKVCLVSYLPNLNLLGWFGFDVKNAHLLHNSNQLHLMGLGNRLGQN